jgi:hypothetical protein
VRGVMDGVPALGAAPSTIKAFIKRFREAPPAPSSQREAPVTGKQQRDAFWWLTDDKPEAMGGARDSSDGSSSSEDESSASISGSRSDTSDFEFDSRKEDFDKKTEELLKKCDFLLQAHPASTRQELDSRPERTNLAQKQYDDKEDSDYIYRDDAYVRINHDDVCDDVLDDDVILPWVSLDVNVHSEQTGHHNDEFVTVENSNHHGSGVNDPQVYDDIDYYNDIDYSINDSSNHDSDGKKKNQAEKIEADSRTTIVMEGEHSDTCSLQDNPKGEGAGVRESACFEGELHISNDDLFAFLSPSSSLGISNVSASSMSPPPVCTINKSEAHIRTDQREGDVNGCKHNSVFNPVESVEGSLVSRNGKTQSSSSVINSGGVPAVPQVSTAITESCDNVNLEFSGAARIGDIELGDTICRKNDEDVASSVLQTKTGGGANDSEVAGMSDEPTGSYCCTSILSMTQDQCYNKQRSITSDEVEPFLGDEIVAILWKQLQCVRSEIDKHDFKIAE